MTSVENTLARLARANPIPNRRVAALVPEPWSEQLLAGILSDPPAEPRRKRRLRPRSRRLVLAAVVLALLGVPTYAVAHGLVDGWLAGEPAPPSVVANFDSYTPQLGFRPDADQAVRVATDGDVSLYATTNDRGSYCLATGTPDGGTCIARAEARARLVAGIVADGPSRSSSEQRVVVAGRVDDPRARTIRFTSPDGDAIVKPVGSSGFFVAAVPLRDSPCAGGDWRPAFRPLGADGEDLGSATVTLAVAPHGLPQVCQWTPPHP